MAAIGIFLLFSIISASFANNNFPYYPDWGSRGYFGPFIPITRLFNVNDGDGNYDYGYQTANGISARETGRYVPGLLEGGGTVAEGSYSYTAPDGQTYSVSYTADENGFHPVGAHIPTPDVLAGRRRYYF